MSIAVDLAKAEQGGTTAPAALCFGGGKLSDWASSARLWANERWRLAKGGGKFPWRPTLADQFKRWLLSTQFRTGLRLALGLAWTGTFAISG